MEKKQTTTKGLRSKLTAALCMLLVGVTLVVSSTYAWVVLSTAPEVKGIDTNVGANGALEIWLNEDQGESYQGSNLVDFSGGEYGFDQLTLIPAALRKNSADDTKLSSSFLKVPVYAANGIALPDLWIEESRINAGKMNAEGNFLATETGHGVRGVGVTSEATARGLAFNKAKTAVESNRANAISKVKSSLNANGAMLGGIILDKVNNATAYTGAKVAALGNLIGGLENAMNYVEAAYENALIAVAASGNAASDAAYRTIQNAFDNGTLTIDSIADSGAITVGGDAIELPAEADDLLAGMRALKATKESVKEAREAYDALDVDAAAETTYTWEQIKDILNVLIVMDNVKLNNQPINDVNVQDLLDSIGNGIELLLEDGAGALVDIAAQCGNYQASLNMNGVAVTMKTNSKKDPSYLDEAKTLVNGLADPDEGGAVSDIAMTDFYGMILDFGFITNAKNSHLLLQTVGVDRIDKDDPTDATLGEGSYMSYWSDGLTAAQIKTLMGCVRIVFFDTNDLTILGEAKLDMDNTTTAVNEDGQSGIKAYMYLEKDGKLQKGEGAKNEIIALGQNQEKYVSVLVYIDGTTLSNKDVAAKEAQSLFGKMNLQFASDADLKPMEYGDIIG